MRPRKRRELLAEKGILVEENGYYVFSRDYEFTSPSLAGAAICGGSTNGLNAWRNEQGKKLKELEAE